MHPRHGFQLHGTENSSDLLCSASNIHPGPIHQASQSKEYCGRDPTDTQNGSPSHDRRALHILWTDQKYHHMHRRQYPLPLKYGYDRPASVRHGPENMLLLKMQDRFLRCKRFSHRHLPVFSDVQMPRSYHWYSKCLYCFSGIFHALYYGMAYCFHSAVFRQFSLLLPVYGCCLPQLLPRRLLLQSKMLTRSFYFYLT